MQRTQNYNLCQWAAEDRILRSDFNADNQKIDAALKAANDAMPRIVTGSYTGDGQSQQFIPLARQPKVLIVTQNGRTGAGNLNYGGVVYPGIPSDVIELTEGGFLAKGCYNPNNGNMTGRTYAYLAIY